MGVSISGLPASSTWPRVTRTLITPAAIPPITIADAKSHLGLFDDRDNARVLEWVKSAARKVEHDTGVSLLTSTWDVGLDAVPQGTVWELPITPVQSITSFTYIDTGGLTQTWASSNYILNHGRIGLADGAVWPTDTRSFAAVTVRVVAGYLTPAAIPADLLHAVRLVVGWLAEPDQVTPLALEVYQQWISPYRMVLVA